MPVLHEAMLGALGRNRESTELPRQADGVVADIDHLLHFTLSLGQDLAGFERDEPTQIFTGGAQLFTEQANQLAAFRRRHRAPDQVSLMRTIDLFTGFLSRAFGQASDHLAAKGRTRDQATVAEAFGRHTESSKGGGDIVDDVDLCHE
jgi:hypothetical protein